MKRITIVGALTLALVLVTGVCAGAFQQSPAEKAKERRQEIQEERADTVQKRIELIITRFNNNKDRHIETYKRAKTRLEEIADALEAEGYDVTRIKSDCRELDLKIKKAATDYAAFIKKLEEAAELAPGAGGGQFAQVLGEARSLLRVFREDILDIRHFYQTVIRKDLEDLKGQNPSESSSSVPATPLLSVVRATS